MGHLFVIIITLDNVLRIAITFFWLLAPKWCRSVWSQLDFDVDTTILLYNTDTANASGSNSNMLHGSVCAGRSSAWRLRYWQSYIYKFSACVNIISACVHIISACANAHMYVIIIIFIEITFTYYDAHGLVPV